MSQTEIGNRQIQSVIAGLVAAVGWDVPVIGEQVFPPVNTYGENFVYETWDNSGLEDLGTTKRGLNATTKEVDPPSNGSVSATLDEWALQTKIDYRVKHAAEIQNQLRGALTSPDGMSAVDRLRLGRAKRLANHIQIQKEKAIAAIAFGTANYDTGLKVTDNSVDFGATGIINTVLTARRAVAKKYGVEPDTFVLGYTKFTDLMKNADVLARVTGGSSNGNPALIDFELLGRLFMVKRFLVGTAVTQTLAAAGAAGTATDIWTATSAAMIYTGAGAQTAGNPAASADPAGTNDLASPAFGKTFYMDNPNTGVRYDIQTWMSDNGKLEFLEATEFFKPAQVMPAGYIWSAAP